MNPDPDEHAPPGQESLQWGTGIKEKNREKKPVSGYNLLTEQARRMFPGESQCRMFCGGKTCKYCGVSDLWKPEQMVIDGLYSEWVTHNILAMARMSNHSIEKYQILTQFRRQGIKTVINLQEPGEHAFCGFGNDASGFSYSPQLLMENGFFYYNFAMKDYGIASMARILDMVKVVQFALSEGKVAIHCHAGLGRTGMLIACYLIYNNRVKAGKCIQYVRSRRPRAIQTTKQMNICHEFQDYLKLFYVIFPNRLPDMPGFSFSHFLSRQRNLLHGYEGRKLKHIPKIIYICCERLLELCGRGHALSSLRHKPRDPLTEGLLAMDENVSIRSDQELMDAHPHHGSSLPPLPFTPTPSSIQLSSRYGDIGTNPISNTTSTAASTAVANTHGRHKKPSPSPLLSKRLQRRRLYDDDDDEEDDYNDNDVDDDDDDDSCFHDHDLSKDAMSIITPMDVEEICLAWTTLEYSTGLTETTAKLKDQLNETDEAWRQLAREDNPLILCAIMWDWLDQLNEPILRAQDVSFLIQHADDLVRALNSLERSTKHFLEYVSCVLAKLRPLDPPLLQHVLEIVLCHLTQKRHGHNVYPQGCSLAVLMEEKPDTSFQLFDLFLQMIDRETRRM